MNRFLNVFTRSKPAIVGMIHVGALPGSPRYEGSVDALVDSACREAEIYLNAGLDSVMLENMHDVPYVQPRNQGPEVVAALTKIASAVKSVLPQNLPVGIQVLAGANKEALAVGYACGLDFTRAEGFVFSHIGDEGTFDACAGELLRYRRNLGAQDILVLTDIKKKHSSHAITADLDVNEVAKAAEFFLSDGVIITGTATGDPPNAQQVKDVKKSVSIPVLVGSGVTTENVGDFMTADALIVGSHFKSEGL
ncbi:unnamed protein product [Nesidiocoris tenuis]|uniref:Uncharacterized protein n=1 Tax=Nesidiocoris tenuis TaxID=355587 RepID=A0A6H5H8A6_9HEMI|nr:unnamed protein product [Nesidiocoris tenuis]